MRKRKGMEQQHGLASGYILWICRHRVPGSNPGLDNVIFKPGVHRPQAGALILCRSLAGNVQFYTNWICLPLYIGGSFA